MDRTRRKKGTLTGKELKKVCGRLTDKELYLGLGWLLREEKIETAEVEKDIYSAFEVRFALKFAC